MAGFTKLDSNIVDSSIWGEPYHRRIVWITFLAKKDHAGIIRASVSGMQRAANVTMEEAQDAITCLESPDPDSRTPDNEGRRIQKIEGGWKVLNHQKYRDYSYSTSPDAIRQRKHREKQPVTERDMSRTPRDISASVSASEGKGSGETGFADPPLVRLMTSLNTAYQRSPKQAWTYADEQAAVDAVKREGWESDLELILTHRRKLPLDDRRFFAPSVFSCLSKFDEWLDKARAQKIAPIKSTPPPKVSGSPQDEATLKKMAAQLSAHRKALR